mmetsp:Transcript_85322/g.276274  ORF Transcript_85322/g.276274 Transcript_85322/m.276274 type:complete len:283 (+) Transcript_85322:501-1349(+)
MPWAPTSPCAAWTLAMRRPTWSPALSTWLWLQTCYTKTTTPSSSRLPCRLTCPQGPVPRPSLPLRTGQRTRRASLRPRTVSASAWSGSRTAVATSWGAPKGTQPRSMPAAVLWCCTQAGRPTPYARQCLAPVCPSSKSSASPGRSSQCWGSPRKACRRRRRRRMRRARRRGSSLAAAGAAASSCGVAWSSRRRQWRAWRLGPESRRRSVWVAGSCTAGSLATALSSTQPGCSGGGGTTRPTSTEAQLLISRRRTASFALSSPKRSPASCASAKTGIPPRSTL